MYKVLILDSERGSRYFLHNFIWSRYGFDIPEEFDDAREALNRISKGGVDLVIMDVRPKGMEAQSFLDELKEYREPGAEYGSPTVVIMSSARDFEYSQQIMGLGVFDYLMKPLNVGNFGNMLQQVAIFIRRHHNSGEKEPRFSWKSLEGGAQVEEKSFHAEEFQRLKTLLFSGDRGFCALCDMLSERIDKDSMRNILEELEKALREEYPWIGCIGENLPEKPESYKEWSRALFHQVEQYELSSGDSLLRKLCSYVSNNLEEDISLYKGASAIGISADYAGRLFRQKTGMHFATFIMRLKMERGRKLLEQGELRNYEISNRLGYSNPDYFRQLFKKYTGMTPTEYRHFVDN